MSGIDPRTLKVEFISKARDYRGPSFDWGLERGFRASVLDAGWLALFLGSRQADPLELQPHSDEDAFLLGLPGDSGEAGLEFLERGRELWQGLAWQRGVIALLADFRERNRLAPLRKSAGALAGLAGNSAAFWVWQPLPRPARASGVSFLALEQQLYQWGRVGRHVRRYCRWRSWLPW